MFNVSCTTRRIKTVQGISHAQHMLQYFKRGVMTDKRMRQPLHTTTHYHTYINYSDTSLVM